MDRERLKRRVQGRKIAQQVLELIQPNTDLPGEQEIEAFLDELRGGLFPQPFSSEEVEKPPVRRLLELQEQTLSFGEHRGKFFYEVPRDYLHWLLYESEQTNKNIAEYLEATKDQDTDDDD